MKFLLKRGCTILREGGAHTIVCNPANGRQSSVPRHPDIDANLSRGICKQLGIAPPPGR
jgi:hypothetical protein